MTASKSTTAIINDIDQFLAGLQGDLDDLGEPMPARTAPLPPRTEPALPPPVIEAPAPDVAFS